MSDDIKTDENGEQADTKAPPVERLVMCDACTKRGQTWEGSSPRCAFEGGRFSENWNCATTNLIRDICYEGQDLPHGVDYQYCEDQKYATIKVDHIELDDSPLALWVSWYKSRGATDAMWLLYENAPPCKPTEAQCLKIVAAYT
jgi:hypothetical protein